MSGLELWGGVECTVARLGDGYRDQVAETGHHERIGDLDLVAGLGIRTLRYPVLWEAVSPDIVRDRDWRWHDERLARLRALGIDPIVGLVHHGSGPRDTNLLDPAFPARLARHARAVAERYPWVTRYTPVNEPLTTARFSALYGHWYPHSSHYPDFLRALVTQCRAVVLAMEAIREVNPAAELVQTEDIGQVFSTEALAYQAAHENERSWLSLDLLFGRVVPGHPSWPLLLGSGIDRTELDGFVSARPPDIVGVNHYLTSDRYLDEDLASYPVALHGSNGRHRYADVEAVRIGSLDRLTGMLPRIRQVAQRYGAPVAVTEVHHGCTRDEQLRWLHEVWAAATAARAEGLDVRAVTLWSLFGACDWNSLLARTDGIYEPGAFDARGPSPRPTALAHAARALTSTETFDHPVLAQPGWWRRRERFYGRETGPPSIAKGRGAVLALIAEPGGFARECLRIAHHRGLDVETIPPGSSITPFDRPIWGVFDAGGIIAGPAAWNGAGLFWLTTAAAADLPYVFLSRSDVFDARSGDGFVESDVPMPRSIAGRRRAAQEEVVLAAHPGALVVRSGSLFGPGAGIGRAPGARRLASRGAKASSDRPGERTYVPDLVQNIFDLMLDRDRGIRHLVNGGSNRAGANGRPGSVASLATERGDLMPPLESALTRDAERQEQDRHQEPELALDAAESHRSAGPGSDPGRDLARGAQAASSCVSRTDGRDDTKHREVARRPTASRLQEPTT